jgi:hypothetical protein
MVGEFGGRWYVVEKVTKQSGSSRRQKVKEWILTFTSSTAITT